MEVTRLIEILEAEGLDGDEIIKAIKYISRGFGEKTADEKILRYIEKQ